MKIGGGGSSTVEYAKHKKKAPEDAAFICEKTYTNEGRLEVRKHALYPTILGDDNAWKVNIIFKNGKQTQTVTKVMKLAMVMRNYRGCDVEEHFDLQVTHTNTKKKRRYC